MKNKKHIKKIILEVSGANYKVSFSIIISSVSIVNMMSYKIVKEKKI